MADQEEHSKRTDGLDEEISSFDALCERVLKTLDKGVAASAALRDAILEGRPESIRTAGSALGAVAEALEEIQYERLGVVRRICRRADLPEPRTIEEIPRAVSAAAGVFGDGRPAIPGAEREKALEIARINATCQEMAEDSTEAVNFTLGLISAANGEGGTYDGRGRVAGQGPGRTILDRKA